MKHQMFHVFSLISKYMDKDVSDIVSMVFSTQPGEITKQLDRNSFVDFLSVLKGQRRSPTDLISYIYYKMYDDYRKCFLGELNNGK